MPIRRSARSARAIACACSLLIGVALALTGFAVSDGLNASGETDGHGRTDASSAPAQVHDLGSGEDSTIAFLRAVSIGAQIDPTAVDVDVCARIERLIDATPSSSKDLEAIAIGSSRLYMHSVELGRAWLARLAKDRSDLGVLHAARTYFYRTDLRLYHDLSVSKDIDNHAKNAKPEENRANPTMLDVQDVTDLRRAADMDVTRWLTEHALDDSSALESAPRAIATQRRVVRFFDLPPMSRLNQLASSAIPIEERSTISGLLLKTQSYLLSLGARDVRRLRGRVLMHHLEGSLCLLNGDHRGVAQHLKDSDQLILREYQFDAYDPPLFLYQLAIDHRIASVVMPSLESVSAKSDRIRRRLELWKLALNLGLRPTLKSLNP